jgi:hypothetical protein
MTELTDTGKINEKARRFDELEALVAQFYEEDGEDKPEYDLCDIGEAVARYFGYI